MTHDHGSDCGALLAKLDVLLDRELPQDELDQLEAHVLACLHCADRRDFEAELRAVIRDRCVEEAPSDLVDRLRARLELDGA